MGFGPVSPELETAERVFHAPWEARALALTMAAAALGHWSTDGSRFARESLTPAVYYASSYYEIWIRALTNLLVDKGLITLPELASSKGIDPPRLTMRPRLHPEAVAGMLAKGSPYNRPNPAPPLFQPNDPVQTINDHPRGHTRLPRYARARRGVIESVRGSFVFPDANAHGPDNPQWCYTVVFEARELWGESADPNSTVSIDAFEPYLRAA